MAVHSFDSGLPIEEVVRDELRRILPARYSVRAGTVVDATGYTAGDCDVVVFNDIWFPVVKPGPVESARQFMLPIEGVYAVGEVKQTLSGDTLTAALKKLVACHRLERPETFAHRLVENREQSDCVHGLTNPLYSFVVALDVGVGETFESLIDQFFTINQTLRRLDVVRAMSVFGHGTVIWGVDDPEDPTHTTARAALFQEEDLYKRIYPMFFRATDHGPALYGLLSNLLLHLFHSVLAPEDFAANYGQHVPLTSLPTDRKKISLAPDAEWLERLDTPCSKRHHRH